MAMDAIKLELINWLSQLEDNETIEYLKILKDSQGSKSDLTNEEKAGIDKGLKDVDAGRTIAHEDVKRKYGL